MLSKSGRQHLDSQELGSGVLANARRGETNIEAIPETGEQAWCGTINGVAPELATLMGGGSAEYGAGVSRLLSLVDNVPNDTIIDSGRKRCNGVELHPHRSGGTAHSVRRWRSKWPAASIHIASNEYDVCAASTLTSTEAERVQTHEVGDVAHAIACFIDRL
jgi:hypothetical protein